MEESYEQEGQEEHYLHPSLLAPSTQSAPPPPLPTVAYKPSADCTYSQLVNRIQGTHTETFMAAPTHNIFQQMTFEQQQYYQQYYYATQYYEYYKQMAQQFQALHPEHPQDDIPAEMFIPNNVMPDFMQSQAAYSHYLQQHSSTNPYAQIVSNLAHKDMPANYNDIEKAPLLYNQNESVPIPLQLDTMNITIPKLEISKEVTTKKPLLFIAEYGSDSDNENTNSDEVKVPPNETQQIIDKMASYVTKNGKDFESIVKAKGDLRFEFLKETHEYYPYYRLKVREHTNKLPEKPANNSETKEQCNGISNKLKEKKIVTPVSFSIKKAKEEIPKDIKSALPVEESDDDQEKVASPKTPDPATPPCAASLTPPISNNQVTAVAPVTLNKTEPDGKDAETSLENIDAADELILEMIDLTDDLVEEHRENKRAEDRKKDKVVGVAQEKLALQLERKKKAAAFLKLKSAETEKPNKKHEEKEKKSTESKHGKTSSNSKLKDKGDADVLKIEDSESEEGEIKKHKKSSRKKKSHKRKHSKSRHDIKTMHKSREHKKTKKRRKRSVSGSSHSSASSQ